MHLIHIMGYDLITDKGCYIACGFHRRSVIVTRKESKTILLPDYLFLCFHMHMT